MVSAGCWHAAALGKDGRVCTRGWGPEALSSIKAIHVVAGSRSTFVVSDDGSVSLLDLGIRSFSNIAQSINRSIFSCVLLSLFFLFFEWIPSVPLSCSKHFFDQQQKKITNFKYYLY